MSVSSRVLGGVAVTPSGAPARLPRGRLVGWIMLVGTLALLSYSASLAADDVPDDVLYRWSTSVAAVVQYGIILGVVLLLARGVDRAELGLRSPVSWRRAAGLVVVAYLVTAMLAAALNVVLPAGEEQGLVPDEWDSSRAAPFFANAVVVAVIAPVVEELTYRGAGLAFTTDRWGTWIAVGVTSLAFGLAHGLIVALPILTLFGLVLALVRLRTRSLYPAILLHAVFNAVALAVGVAGGV